MAYMRSQILGVRSTVLILLICGAARADFSYQMTSKMTGGTLMKFASIMGDKIKQATDATVSVKGDRMAHVTGRMSSIIDLEAQTITTVNFDRKTYSVMTFEEMKKMMENVSANPQAPSLSDMKISMKEGPGTQVALGHETHEELVTVDLAMTDPKSGHAANMQVISDMFLARGIPGADEMRAFHKRMGEKVAWAPGGMPMMNQPAVAKAMSQMYASGAKFDGLPLITVISINGALPGMPSMGDAGAAGAALPPGLAGAMAGRLAQFGRKKKAASADPAQDTASASSALMEMTMEVVSTSAAPVDPAIFQVPSGFEKTDPPQMRQGRSQ